MRDLERINYSPSDIKEVVERLQRTGQLLQSIFDERAYDENSRGPLDLPTLVGFQEQLKREYEIIIKNHICLLTATYSIKDIHEWCAWVERAYSDKRTINTDALPRYGENLTRATKRVETWTTKIEGSRKWRDYIWQHIKQNRIAYAIAFLTGIITSLIASWLLTLFY